MGLILLMLFYFLFLLMLLYLYVLSMVKYQLNMNLFHEIMYKIRELGTKSTFCPCVDAKNINPCPGVSIFRLNARGLELLLNCHPGIVAIFSVFYFFALFIEHYPSSFSYFSTSFSAREMKF